MQQRLLALTVFLAALLQSAAAQAPLATTLQPPTRQLPMADSFNRTKAFPAVSNGHVLVFPRVVTERDTILVTSLSTEVRQSVPFAIAGRRRSGSTAPRWRRTATCSSPGHTTAPRITRGSTTWR